MELELESVFRSAYMTGEYEHAFRQCRDGWAHLTVHVSEDHVNVPFGFTLYSRDSAGAKAWAERALAFIAWESGRSDAALYTRVTAVEVETVDTGGKVRFDVRMGKVVGPGYRPSGS